MRIYKLMGALSDRGGLDSPRRLYRFGSFELRTETGELSKRGIRLRLQTKPLQVLEALLARPGDLITREELCACLWPGTFVDFESGLNTAINRLRTVLGDSADAPRYIETLPRLGYRFLSPVEIIEGDALAVAPPRISTAPVQTAAAETEPVPVSKAPSERTRFSKILRITTLAGIAGVSVFAFAYLRGNSDSAHAQPRFRQLTFRAGKIISARFAPQPGKIIYTAGWRAGERETYVLDLSNSASHLLPFVPGTLEGVSATGDLLFASRNSMGPGEAGAVSLVPIAGGKPRVVAERVRLADFDRSGGKLAVVRQNIAGSSVEFPPGHAIYSSRGWISSLRVAPCGSIVAFLEHPLSDDDAGYVRIARLNGTSRVMTGEWSSIDGLAWSPSGNEIWFTASKTGGSRSLYAVSEAGKLRRISNSPLSLRVLDVANSGSALVSLDDYRTTIMAELPGDTLETDLSKFDFSYVEDISANGKLVLFTEGGAGGGRHYTAFVYNQQTHQTTRVGSGRGFALSPDGRSALMMDPENRADLMLVPLAGGRPRSISGHGFQYQWARFAGRDGRTLLVGGSYPGDPLGIYRQSVEGTQPDRLEGLPYIDRVIVSRDGSQIAGLTTNGTGVAFDLVKHSRRELIPGSSLLPIAWGRDDRSLYVLLPANKPAEIVRLNPANGETSLWKSIGPTDLSGFLGLANVVAVPELGAYAYSAAWDLSRLYLVDGWS